MSFRKCWGWAQPAKACGARPVGGLASVEAVEPRVLMCSFTHADVTAAAVAGHSTAPADLREATTAAGAMLSGTPTPAVLRIDSAGAASYTDSAGAVWSKDTGFTGGSANTSTFGVAGTADDALYATRRTGNFSYANAVPSGTYTLRLLFADHLTTSGSRKFNVSAEGVQVLTNFDIVASGGGGRTALVKQFAVKVADGRLDLKFTGVVGGATVSGFELLSGSNTPTPTPGTGWSQAAPAPQALFESQGAAAGGRMLLFGGFYNSAVQATRAAYAYNPATNGWSRIADLPTKVTHAGVAADGNKVWIAGGLVGDYGSNPPTRDVWRYDATTNAYSRGPSLPAARGAGALVKLGRNLHYFGGLKADNTDSADHWVLNLDGGTAWRTAAPLPNARNHLGGAALNGKVYAIGGQHRRDETNGNVNSVHAYDPASNAWRSVASLAKPRSHFGNSTLVVGGSIWVMGGVTQGRTPLSNVSRYDPTSNAWTEISPLPGARKAPVATGIGTKVYVATGSTGDSSPQVTHWVRSI